MSHEQPTDLKDVLRRQAETALRAAMPAGWPQLEAVFDHYFSAHPLPPEMDLPFIAAQALGGNPKAAVPAAGAVLSWSVRDAIFQDDPSPPETTSLLQKVGHSRWANYASSFTLLSLELLRQSNMPPDVYLRVQGGFLQSGMQMAEGQDRAALRQFQNLHEYWRVMESTTAVRYATAALSGALSVSSDPRSVRTLAAFGHHLGMALHIRQELQSFAASAPFDPEKCILAILFGLEWEHTNRDELRELVEAERVETNGTRVKEILDQMETVDFMETSWAGEAQKAKEMLQGIPLEKAGLLDFMNRILPPP